MDQRELRGLRTYALYCIVAAALLAVVFLFYFSRTKQNIQEQAEAQLTEVTRQYANAIKADMRGNIQTVEALAHVFGELGQGNPETIIPLITGAVATLGLKRMGFVTLDGMAHTTDGLTFDARDRLYFKRALTASSTVAILLVDKTDNTPINVYVSPIVHKGKVLGALFATVQTDAFIMSIDDRLFNGSGQVLVTNNQGHILFRGRGPIPLARYNNIAELIPTGVPPAPGNDIPDTFGSGGLFRYDGSPYYMAHSKLEITSTDWHIFSIVPEDTLTANVGTIQREVLYLMLFFIGLSMVFLWLVLRMQGRQAKRLRRAKQFLETVIENIPGGFFRYSNDEKQEFDYISEGFLKLLGHTRASFREAYGNRFDNLVHPEDRKRVLESINSQIMHSDYDTVEYRVTKADGRILWLFDKAQLVRDENGRSWFYVIVMDITSLRNTQQELKISEERYRILTELSERIIFEHDIQTRRSYFSPRFREKFGYDPAVDSASGSLSEHCIHTLDRPLYRRFVTQILSGHSAPAELRFLKQPSGFLWCRVQAVAIFDESGQPVRLVGEIEDIDAEKRDTERLRMKAQLDPLTGLYNASSARKRIEASLQQPPSVGMHVLTVIDINHFKQINDTCGHLTGDHALIETARRLGSMLNEGDIAGRIGGDEFVIISFAHSMAQSARQMGYMRQELLDHGCELSVGMAESDDGEDIPDLVNQAENEMRKDKKRYYASGSGKRQLRTLNKQLEDILVRNKDMESLLQHLNTRYSIAYVVNLRADTQRPVVVPGYVQKMLDKHGGSFHEMLLDYCDNLVAPAYRDGYDYVRDRICREGAIRYAYVRNDGERFLITIFPDTHSVDEVMWVFAKEDTSSEE